MRTRGWMGLLAALLLISWGSAAWAARATPVENAVWANDELYGTVITPTSFRVVPEGTTDIIYSFMMSGLAGQRGVAETAPGMPDYNGGRWNVQMAVFTDAGLEAFDPDGDGMANFEVTNVEELLERAAMGQIEVFPADFYFECPLRPRD